MKPKTYSLTHKGQRLATCKFSVRKRSWIMTANISSEAETYSADTDIAPIWKAFKTRIQDELGVTVKRGRPKLANKLAKSKPRPTPEAEPAAPRFAAAREAELEAAI